MKSSIKKKLMRLLLLAIAGLVVVGLMGTVGMQRIKSASTQMHGIEANVIQSQQAVNQMLDLRIQLREALVNAADPVARAASVDDIKALNSSLYELTMSLRDTVASPRSIEILDELEELYAWLMVQEMSDYYNLSLAGDAEGMQTWLRAHITYALHYQALCEELCDWEMEQAEAIGLQSSRQANLLTAGSNILLFLACALLLLLGYRLVNSISVPLRKMAAASEQLALGDVQADVTVDSDDEVGVLSKAFHRMIQSISQQADIMHAVSQGDYTVEASPRCDRDLMGKSIKQMVDSGNEIMSKIGSMSNMVSIGAEQVAQVAQSLSSNSSVQMASLQSFNALMKEVIDGNNVHAEKAGDSLEVADKLCEMIAQSNEDMHAILVAMNSIDNSTGKVSDIVSLIEDIASQTNILSLNAAVEAARAGPAGKGFAVVADEVRNLAAKSAEAVGSISMLIQDSRNRVNEGNRVVEATNARIEHMKTYILDSYQLFREIADNPLQQGSGQAMEQGIAQVNKIVQENLATAQEAASTAEELSAQAIALQDLISHFKLDSDMRLYREEKWQVVGGNSTDKTQLALKYS